MSRTRHLRRALPAGVLALALVAAPALADFHPSIVIQTSDANEDLTASDMGFQGAVQVVGIDRSTGAGRSITMAYSTDRGASWSSAGQADARESQVTVCGGDPMVIYAQANGPGSWTIGSMAFDVSGSIFGFRDWTSSGVARKPDVACVAGARVVAAWFQKSGSDYRVKVRAQKVVGEDLTPQAFDLGVGTMGRGLAVATSKTRAYVAWFQGNDLKLRRFSIGTDAGHTLTSLGTSTIASLRYGLYPELGAQGSTVVLALMDRASLKVRRSTNSGGSFGASVTLRTEPFPSEIGISPTTVAVRGSRVAIGAIEIGGDITVQGKGFGYLSTNRGSSFTKQASHAGGRTVASLVLVGDTYRYSEAWDQSISDPTTQVIRYRRQ